MADTILDGSGEHIPGRRPIDGTDLEIAYSLLGDDLVLRVNKPQRRRTPIERSKWVKYGPRGRVRHESADPPIPEGTAAAPKTSESCRFC